MKTVIYFSLLLGYFPAFSQQQKLEEILKEANVSGIQLIYAKGDKFYAYNAGVVKDSSDKKISSGTVFYAASLSKCVFAYAFFRLYDKGLIDLDTPLLNYIGSYDRFKPDDPRFRKITARMVLRHTTGLPNWGNDSSVSLIFTPDSCFSYSGEGYWFLQRVMEKIESKPLNQIAQEEVFTPLNMTSSSYIWKDMFVTRVGFDRDSVRDKKDLNAEANAAFSMLTNATDYTIFLQAVMSGKGLRPATHKLMLEKSSAANRFQESETAADPYIDWGLGVGLQHNEKGDAFWHWGDGYGGVYKCFFIAYPGTKESLVFFTHSSNGLNMVSDVLNLFYGSQTCWAMKWLGYGYESPLVIKEFRGALLEHGFEHAQDLYQERKRKNVQYQIAEHDLNSLGYLFLQQKKNKEALEIFKLNTILYPKSWNVYDSEAEAYEDLGDHANAIILYKRSVELNPKNSNGIEHLKKLEPAAK